jgi:hypothetical protein
MFCGCKNKTFHQEIASELNTSRVISVCWKKMEQRIVFLTVNNIELLK